MEIIFYSKKMGNKAKVSESRCWVNANTTDKFADLPNMN